MQSSGGGDDSWSDDKRPFPNSTLSGYVLATKDGTIESGSSFIGHAGLVFDHTQTVESSPWKGGVYKGDSDDWMGWDSVKHCWKKKTLYILFPDPARSNKWNQTSPAADWAYTQIGRPYNWNYIDRWTSDSYYCSQLVWKAYLAKLDIDLCPGAITWVSPGDIINSRELDIFYSRLDD